jgi:hypothetical protein
MLELVRCEKQLRIGTLKTSETVGDAKLESCAYWAIVEWESPLKRKQRRKDKVREMKFKFSAALS